MFGTIDYDEELKPLTPVELNIIRFLCKFLLRKL